MEISKFIFSNYVISTTTTTKHFLFFYRTCRCRYYTEKSKHFSQKYNFCYYTKLKISFPLFFRKDSHVLLNFIYFNITKIEHNESPKELEFIFYICGVKLLKARVKKLCCLRSGICQINDISNSVRYQSLILVIM